jgi:hypothetical protein
MHLEVVMGLFSKLFGKKESEDVMDVYNLDLIPEIDLSDMTDLTLPTTALRRKKEAEERVRVTLTMKKSFFEDLRRFCAETNTNASQALRSGHKFSEHPFRKNPKLIREFDE